MAETISLEDLKSSIGQAQPPSDWFLIDQKRINQFADVTEDQQFIHTDPARAKDSPFGGTIAHGFLTLSMLSRLAQPGSGESADLVLVEGKTMGINYGFNKLRFVNPVKVNAEIRLHRTLASVEEKDDGRLLVTTAITVEIKGEDKPAIVGEWLTMMV